MGSPRAENPAVSVPLLVGVEHRSTAFGAKQHGHNLAHIGALVVGPVI